MTTDEKLDKLIEEVAELKRIVKKEKPKKKKCPHLNVQPYSECCNDCGKNIYS
jgi:hypothetical protein